MPNDKEKGGESMEQEHAQGRGGRGGRKRREEAGAEGKTFSTRQAMDGADVERIVDMETEEEARTSEAKRRSDDADD
eukprot:656709-Hanusia_phi.AAC.1